MKSRILWYIYSYISSLDLLSQIEIVFRSQATFEILKEQVICLKRIVSAMQNI